MRKDLVGTDEALTGTPPERNGLEAALGEPIVFQGRARDTANKPPLNPWRT